MHERVMSPDAALNGHALGFYERTSTVAASSATARHSVFHSVLSLMPETGIGRSRR